MKKTVFFLSVFFSLFHVLASADVVVGKIADKLDVTPNGQFHYEIPISVAPGTGGMSPHLSIVYDSSNGTGLFGRGFDLSGISIISRAPRNLYRDGKADVIRFDACDRFMLDGVRLTLVNTTATCREYRTENNCFSKIIAEGDVANPSKFTVRTKDGLVREYTNAKGMSGTSGNNLFWVETKVADTKGNYYKIIYGTDSGHNEFWPVRIDYTGNSGAGLSPYASVRFDYTASGRSPKFISGEKVCKSRAISSISCFYGDVSVRKYDIKYDITDNELYVSSITESTNAESKNPTVFYWNNKQDNNTDIQMPVVCDRKDYITTVKGDFNGDGRTDILVRSVYSDRNYYKIYLGNNDGVWLVKDYGSLNFCTEGTFLFDEHSDKKGILDIKSGDFNGDGLDDIIVEREKYPFSCIDLYLFKVDNDGNVSLEYEKNIVPSLYGRHVIHVTDLNCDGAADLFIRGFMSDEFCMLVSESSETGIQPLVRQFEEKKLSNDNTWNSVSLIDIDGDGTSEVMNMYDKGHIYLYSVTSDWQLENMTAWSFDTDYFCLGDFNGDGKTDVITMGTDDKHPEKNWSVNFSTGELKKDLIPFSSESMIPLFNPKEKHAFVADINGDGYDDLYAVSIKTAKNAYVPIDIYINDGTGRNFTHYTDKEVGGCNVANFKFGDFNGDGKTDFITYPNYNCSSPVIDLYISRNKSTGLLVFIKDGMGNETRVEYSNLTDKSTLKRGKQYSYPIVSAGSTWSVVRRLSTPDGVGGERTLEYQYKDLLYHKRGRGILGFESVTATDSKTNVTTRNDYEILAQEAVPALKYSCSSVNGKLQNETKYTNVIDYQYNYGKAEVVYTCRPAKTEEYSYEYNTGEVVSDKESSFEYDKYGNCTKSSVSVNGKNVVTENIYWNDETNWLLGRLSSATVTKSGNGESTVLSSSYKYDNNTGLLTEENFEPNDVNGYKKKYSYDVFGNITRSVTVPNNTDYDSRSMDTKYSSDGRFVVSTENSLSFVTKSTVDASLGVETEHTDENGLSTTFKHDSFGSVTCVNAPLGFMKTTTEWSSGNAHAPEHSVYCIRTQKQWHPLELEFFDCLGRSLRKVIEGADGRMVYTDTKYNDKGQVSSVSKPYFCGEAPVWDESEYDASGRTIKRKRANGGTDFIDYSGLTVSVTDENGNTSSKVYDMEGNLVKSSDAMGNSVCYKYNAQGKCTEVDGPRTVTSVEYDKYGNRTRLVDPDLGTVEYTYSPYGEIVSQKDSKGKTEFEYDQLGRVLEEVRPDFTYSYIYDIPWLGALAHVSCSNGMSRSIRYDSYGRIISELEVVDGKKYTTNTSYNDKDQIDTVVYPSGFSIRNSYTANGYLNAVSSADGSKAYWRALNRNAAGQILSESLGNGLNVNSVYDVAGRIESIQVPDLLNKIFCYDMKGNLTSRTDEIRHLSESFTYDALDRLTEVSGENGNVQEIRYDEAGNIIYKTGLGNVSYIVGTNKIGSVKGETYKLPAFDEVRYTSFNKISEMRRNVSENPLRYYVLSIDYGTDKSKKVEKTSLFVGGCGQNFENHYQHTKKKVFVNDLYSEEIMDGHTKSLNYILAGGKAVAVHEMEDNNTANDVYVHYDNLGSVVAYSNETGNIIEELSYDAWGRRRNAETWEYFTLSNDSISEYSKGFTGHDHIDMFDVVNMDGRMYDPLVGRFMSPDPIVQMPEYTQSLNRYAYCVNNPLSLTDPTGYSWIGDTFSALVGIAVGLETGGIGAGVYGAVIGGMAGGATTALVNSMINGANLMQAVKNTFTGGFWGGVSGFANFEIGNLENVYLKIAAHSVSEGAMEGIRGGHFEHGFFVGMASAAGGSVVNGGMCDRLSAAERVAVNAALGGIVSELGGGKFASGAMTGAYVMMFNELKHRTRYVRQHKATLNAVVALDEKVGGQNMKINVCSNIIETYYKGNMSLEVILSSDNTKCYAGDVKGAFEATLDIDGQECTAVLTATNHTFVTTYNYNFSGDTKFSILNYNSYHSINTTVFGNWVVDTGAGRLNVNHPTIVGFFYPLKYKHTFKIK